MNRRGAPDRVFVLDQAIKVIYQSILVLALYFVFAGHNLPGGGFVGGLMVGAAVSLRYVSGGAEAVRTTFRAPSHVVLGCGLLLSSGTALVPVLLGGAVLEHGEIEPELPVFGKVKVVSALPFDVGVLLVVVGLVLMLFAAFGDDHPIESAESTAAVNASDDEPDNAGEST
ncbi:MnhB domain-containing protein [uncultured Ilumatobacter sp.]|uniref:MnhB domain-containing protein n=1 Tax=uncultured Ilumatobacter sp. TaxID=879968 RepID=UPI00374F64B2